MYSTNTSNIIRNGIHYHEVARGNISSERPGGMNEREDKCHDGSTGSGGMEVAAAAEVEAAAVVIKLSMAGYRDQGQPTATKISETWAPTVGPMDSITYKRIIPARRATIIGGILLTLQLKAIGRAEELEIR